MKYVRTPDERFQNLPDFPFEPNYIDIDCADGTTLRMHYLDEGPKEGPLVLCMHGQPTWSYLYRKMIPGFVGAGMRVIAPDLIGFGRSDKPTDQADYTYSAHVNWVNAFVRKLDLNNINLFCQDWGGMIGLRVAADNETRFARIVAANTGMPDADEVPDEEVEPRSKAVAKRYAEIPIPPTLQDMAVSIMSDQSDLGFEHWDIKPFFLHWVKYCAEGNPRVKDNLAMSPGLSEAEAAAYDAPFPGEEYMAGSSQNKEPFCPMMKAICRR